MHDAGVAGQLIDMARGAAARQIGRGGAGDKTHIADLTADQGGILQLADTHGAIDAFLGQVDQAVGDADIEFDVGINAVELPDMRHHQGMGDGGRQIDAQLALRLQRAGPAKARFGSVNRAKYLDALAKIISAVLGQRQAPRGAGQQLYAKIGFQILQGGGQRRARQIEGFSRF